MTLASRPAAVGRHSRRAALQLGAGLSLALAAACAPGAAGTSGSTGGAAAPKAADLSTIKQKVVVWGPTGNAVDPGRQAQLDLWNTQHANLAGELSPAPFTTAQGIEALAKL